MAGIILLSTAAVAESASITLAWDYDQEAQTKITGFALYSSPADVPFNYSDPIASMGPTLRSVTVDVNETAELKFVIRAYKETPNKTYYSEDSNVVYHAIVVPPTNLRRE